MNINTKYLKNILDEIAFFIYNIRMKIAGKKIYNHKNRPKNKIIKNISPYIFWDMNIDLLDYKYHYQYIIERIVIYGNSKDEQLMYKLYPKRKIIKCITKLYIYNDTVIEYYSSVFDLKKEDFKCYGKIPSHVNC